MVGTQYTEYYWWHSGYDSSDGSWVGGSYPSCTEQWLSFEFNDPVILSGYRITSRGLTAYAETDSPKGWALQWSVNGNPPWITVQRVTDEPTWLPLTSREFVVPLAPASKYYRLYFENDAQHNDIGGIHDAGGPSDGPRCVVVLAELELFAAFPAPPSPPPPTPPTLPPLPPIAPVDWGTRLIPSSTYVSSQHDTDTTSCGGGNDQCGQSTQDGDLSTGLAQLLVERTAVRWWWPRMLRRGRGQHGDQHGALHGHRVDPLQIHGQRRGVGLHHHFFSQHERAQPGGRGRAERLGVADGRERHGPVGERAARRQQPSRSCVVPRRAAHLLRDRARVRLPLPPAVHGRRHRQRRGHVPAMLRPTCRGRLLHAGLAVAAAAAGAAAAAAARPHRPQRDGAGDARRALPGGCGHPDLRRLHARRRGDDHPPGDYQLRPRRDEHPPELPRGSAGGRHQQGDDRLRRGRLPALRSRERPGLDAQHCGPDGDERRDRRVFGRRAASCSFCVVPALRGVAELPPGRPRRSGRRVLRQPHQQCQLQRRGPHGAHGQRQGRREL